MRKYVTLVISLLFITPFLWASDLRAFAAEPCEECHDTSDISQGDKSVHPPFEESDCTSCHLDHGDEEKLMLAEEGNALCEECHDFSEEAFLKAHHNISGNRASCIACHDPHRSALDRLLQPDRHRPLAYGRCDPCHRYDGRLLLPNVRDLCFLCHSREEFSQRFTHAPVAQGECLSCHDPHGSREPALLIGYYSRARWIASGEEDYELCLNCHDPGAFNSAGTEEKTHFRSGRLNLHQLHIAGGKSGKVSPDRGLTCCNCHMPHASPESKLIRQELDCGGVPCLKLEYRRRSYGGECRGGCHGPKTYSYSSGEELLPVSLISPPEPAPKMIAEPTPLEKSINKKCRSCHDREVQGFARTYVHSPVRRGNCSACHLDHGPDHKLVLLDRQDRLCARCHDLLGEGAAAAHQGYPLEGTSCVECHDPHSADNSKLLHSLEHEPFAERDCSACHDEPDEGWKIGPDVNEVCAECHDEVAEYKYLHSAIPQKQCNSCHQPHSSEQVMLLRAKNPALCFRCHPRQNFNRENIHPPVEEGDCGACHPAHGSNSPSLLGQPYPVERFFSYREEAYALCWDCHEAESLTDPAISGDSGFQDGKNNLHALHLQNRKTVTGLGERITPGTTCRNCHDPHSTDAPRLIRHELDCGGVPCLQLDFRKVGEGGKCLGGCHVRQSYLPD